MIQYRKILEMFSESFSIRSIASATGHSRKKVKDVIEQSQKRSITYPLTEEMTDAWLEGLLYPEFTMQGSGYRPMDFDYIHKELGKKGVNLRLLHHEYEMNCRAEGTIPYSYRSFLRHYRAFAQKHKATMRIKRKPGQILEVDWAGQTGFIIDRDTGEKVKIYVFVATLPCSQYSYVEGFLSMDSNAWITAHRHAYAYFQGVTELLVPDNLRTGVNEHSREKIVLNPTYKDMANHYQTVVMPARVRAPKDKPNVEGSVRTVSTWVIAAMRTQRYFTVEEWNSDAFKKLEAFNHRAFTKREGSRYSAFIEEERRYLRPLPATPYKMSEWLTAKVQPNYHITTKSQFYSVPYEYIGNMVDIKLTDDLIEVFYHRMRVASHKRLFGKYGQFSTVVEHMPDNHQAYINHTPETARHWANEQGYSTTQVVESIFENSQAERQAVKAVFTLKKSLRHYTKYELEKACGDVLKATKRPNVQLIQSTLKANKQSEQSINASEQSTHKYGFTRGAAYYGGQKNDE